MIFSGSSQDSETLIPKWRPTTLPSFGRLLRPRSNSSSNGLNKAGQALNNPCEYESEGTHVEGKVVKHPKVKPVNHLNSGY
jgi:hypothetical protein